MQVAIVLFDQLTASEAVAPYEVLSRVPAAHVTFVAERIGQVRSDDGSLALVADAALTEVPQPAIVVVPGGRGSYRHLRNGSLHRWLRRAAEGGAKFVGVGNGTLVLGSARLTAGRAVSSPSEKHDTLLRGFGAAPLREPVVVDNGLLTATGAAAVISSSARFSDLDLPTRQEGTP